MIGGVANPTLEEKVCRGILAACQRANWKLGGPRGAAARLGVKRNTLFYKMKRLGIVRPADDLQDLHLKANSIPAIRFK
jgi:transcriptional regulator with GAF, ATPase, and Fis domain